MKRIRRWLFNGLTALSLVLCVATAALWARSYFVVESVFRSRWDAATHESSETDLSWSDGRFEFDFERVSAPLLNAAWRNFGWQHSTTASPPAQFAWWDFKHQPRTGLLGTNGVMGWYETWTIDFRIWALAAVASLLPGYWLFAKIRQARGARSGHCLVCGYDLRATPDRCPECGTIPKVSHGAAGIAP